MFTMFQLKTYSPPAATKIRFTVQAVTGGFFKLTTIMEKKRCRKKSRKIEQNGNQLNLPENRHAPFLRNGSSLCFNVSEIGIDFCNL